MALGNLSTITASNQVRVGNSSVTSIGGQVGWSTLSDGRYKKQVKENVPGLQFIKKLKPVTYHLDVSGVANKLNENRNNDNTSDKQNDDAKTLIEKGRTDKEKILYTGFVAQDVEKSAKEIGYDFSGVDAPKNDDDLYGLRYDAFVVPLVKAVQELSTENDALKETNNVLETRLEKVEKLLAQLTSQTANENTIQNTSVTLSAARLEQNIPNPFSNNSMVKYYLPEKTMQAFLKITDVKGAIIKTISLNAKGSGSISFSNEGLASGVYYYSLIADGKIIDTKKMVIAN
ncbi:MAG TPA: tail fiber domain-containing protein, partial [Panacibacter sp.]|nr:tail fiber domain-containing protein [Panacibacter sp.]